MNTIDEIYAFVAMEEDGEGVAAFLGPDNMWMPMVAADAARLDSLRGIAQELVKHSGQSLKLCRFSRREDIEVIE